MTTLIYIVAIFAMVASLLVVITAVAGAFSCRYYEQKCKLISQSHAEHTDAYSDVGISVIVSGFRELSHVQNLLSLNHNQYEIVLMTDLVVDKYARDLIEVYSMVAMDKTPSNELPCNSVRAVYRSRQRCYHKLIVIDRPRTTISNEFNCGVNLCSYEYVIAIDGWSRLDQGALQHVVTELFEQFENKRIYAIGGFKIGVKPKTKLRIIDTLMRMVVLGAGMSEISKLTVETNICSTATVGRYAGTAILFDREALIDAGGYQDNFYPDTELYTRIRKTMRRRHADATALFIPQVLAYEDGPDQLSGSSLPLKNTSLIEKIISRRMSTLFYIVSIILLAIAYWIDNEALTEIMILTLFMTYFVSVCVVALSLTVADKLLLNHFNYRGSYKLIFSLIIYPFFLLYCLLSPKKFY